MHVDILRSQGLLCRLVLHFGLSHSRTGWLKTQLRRLSGVRYRHRVIDSSNDGFLGEQLAGTASCHLFKLFQFSRIGCQLFLLFLVLLNFGFRELKYSILSRVGALIKKVSQQDEFFFVTEHFLDSVDFNIQVLLLGNAVHAVLDQLLCRCVLILRLYLLHFHHALCLMICCFLLILGFIHLFLFLLPLL